MNDALDLQYDRLLGEGSYGKVFLVKQQDGQEVCKKWEFPGKSIAYYIGYIWP